MGVGTVCDSKQVLQMHPDGIVACDEAAFGELKVDTCKYFKEIYKNEQ